MTTDNNGTAAVRSKPRLVFFQSPSSGRCRRVEGFLAQVLQRRSNHDTFTIQSIPTLVVVADRCARAWLPNPQGCRDIEEFLAPWLR